MDKESDITTFLAGITFKSPVIVSSSEITSSPELIDRIRNRNVGGIVTKTFSGKAQNRIRLHPYQFPLDRFGKGYKDSGTLFSVASPHVISLDQYIEEFSEMAGICAESSIRIIASFYDDPREPHSWSKLAQLLEDAGAEMIELNLSSPSAVKLFSLNEAFSVEILREVKGKISLPIGFKLSPTLEPLEPLLDAWAKEGLDFISAHNAPSGIVIDTDRQEPFGAPVIGAYVPGRLFLPYSLARVVRMRKACSIPIIGIGGIYNSGDALQYILCGCPLVGVGSALYFKGPFLLDEISKGIMEWMQGKGYKSLHEFIGKAFTKIEDLDQLKMQEAYGYSVPPGCPYLPVVIEEKCSRCGSCQETCIYGAISMSGNEGLPSFDEDKCWSCGFCVGICPSGALELRDKGEDGKAIWSNEGIALPFRYEVH